MELRVAEIKRAAEALKKARTAAGLPKKVLAAFRMLEKAEKQLEALDTLRKEVQPSYIRGVVSSIAVRSTGLGNRGAIGDRQLLNFSDQ